MFTQHYRVMHNKKWYKYDYFTDDEKTKFSGIDVPFADAISSHRKVGGKRANYILAPIIDNDVKKHFVPDDTKHGYCKFITQLLERVSGDKHNFTISNISIFGIIVKFFVNGLSFQQAL